MPQGLSKKTVDEVWRDIQQGGKKGSEEGHKGRRERQTTLGEMTLEDFLVKAGVVTSELIANVGQGGSADSMAGQQDFTQGGHWYQQGVMGGYPVLDASYPEGGQMSISSQMMGALSDSQMPGRKRAAAPSEDVEDKSVERRQKRMIKNRESAARSRARKQVELFLFLILCVCLRACACVAMCLEYACSRVPACMRVHACVYAYMYMPRAAFCLLLLAASALRLGPPYRCHRGSLIV